jgi:hypothetical protein
MKMPGEHDEGGHGEWVILSRAPESFLQCSDAVDQQGVAGALGQVAVKKQVPPVTRVRTQVRMPASLPERAGPKVQPGPGGLHRPGVAEQGKGAGLVKPTQPAG